MLAKRKHSKETANGQTSLAIKLEILSIELKLYMEIRVTGRDPEDTVGRKWGLW